MNMETVFKLAINKKTEDINKVVDDFINDLATHSELLSAADDLKALIYMFDTYVSDIENMNDEK